MAEYLTLDQVTELTDLEVTTVRRAARKLESSGEVTIKKGMVPGRSRNALCVSDTDAQKLLEYFRAKENESRLYEPASGGAAGQGTFGHFYLIQLVPEAIPNRVKIGYTDNLSARLKEHQTAAPTAKLVKSWPCKRAWDQAAMDSITDHDCHLIMNEVYEGEISTFVERGDRFFENMPKQRRKMQLSPHSPLFESEPEA